MAGEKKLFTRKEVATNSSQQKAWFIIHDNVYDVTKFLNDHPGGEEILMDHAGKDASEDFDDVGHSTDAKDMMEKWLIGEVVDSEKSLTSLRKSGSKPQASKTVDRQEAGSGLPMYVIVAGIVAALVALWTFVS